MELKQIFCRHRKTDWYLKKGTGLQAISGETRYLVCERCGKIVDTSFHRYEGGGFK